MKQQLMEKKITTYGMKNEVSIMSLIKKNIAQNMEIKKQITSKKDELVNANDDGSA